MRWLTRWWFEAVLAALLAVELATVAAATVARKPTALAVTAVSVLVLLGWRWQPLASTIAAFAALTVSVAVMPQSTTAQFFGTLGTFVVAGAVNREREAVVAWAAGAGMLAYAAWVDPFGGGAPDFALSLAFATTMWAAGLLVARRGRHVRQALRRAEDAERAREAATARALSDERARIARELHDVVSHGLSVVVVQTLAARGALADLCAPDAEKVDRHLDAVESTARDALGEMRRMLGLLQSTDTRNAGAAVAESPSAAAPGLRHLDDLVERATAGLDDVRLQVDSDLELPAGLELAVFRIVQEALTNVVKHSPGSSVDISVSNVAERVRVSVHNTAATGRPTSPRAGSGRGLVGMRERVALYGGTLDAGTTSDGGFRVEAVIPASSSVDAQDSTLLTPR